ncbi:MAG: (d)CMP kinase [Clostridia bacterium]
MSVINIAIDGPAGAGKSTISRKVAAELGFIYIDTGSLYRTVALNAIMQQTDLSDTAAIEKSIENQPKIELGFVDGEQRNYLNGVDVSDKIRTPEISTSASKVSAVPVIRQYLFDLQKTMAEQNSCVMDGRDIGTVVLPNAKVKIFLTASPESRATRRYDELISKGMDVTFEDVLNDMKKRDYDDMNREISPLKAADDAKLLDTSGFELEKSVALVIKTVKENI